MVHFDGLSLKTLCSLGNEGYKFCGHSSYNDQIYPISATINHYSTYGFLYIRHTSTWNPSDGKINLFIIISVHWNKRF